MSTKTLGVYIHIPFCRAKCGYCAFVSRPGSREEQQQYVAALCREISAAGGDFAVPVDTVFFGGGTPTILSVAELTVILDTLRSRFVVTSTAEISLEANPGTVDAESLAQLRQAGFNRLSLGVQSFDDRILRAIGRIHCADEARQAVAAARTAGFDNLSLDLMYGLPGQTVDSWRETLRRAVELAPDHISAYGLKLEEGTALAAQVITRQAILPGEAAEEAMYDYLNAYLPRQGFHRYEISNYARPGKECRHNLKYWRYFPYRGFGAAAHSFDGRARFANTEDVSFYCTRQLAGQSAETFRETLPEPDQLAEYAFLALRTTEGLMTGDFRERFGQNFDDIYAGPVAELIRDGLLIRERDGWRLTEKGFKLSNQAYVKFLP
ncbi:MAG: radical SAM family heme chaperone HemW [Veillonellaceae bacterium]|jgi:oxygen-independent coproporphyrinogen-3 oxidase|nr:radical SAM family heme chaperone HemW [Veillonellaceae bacterium]